METSRSPLLTNCILPHGRSDAAYDSLVQEFVNLETEVSNSESNLNLGVSTISVFIALKCSIVLLLFPLRRRALQVSTSSLSVNLVVEVLGSSICILNSSFRSEHNSASLVRLRRTGVLDRYEWS